MLNLLPALLFLLVQGQADPDTRYSRAEALVLLVTVAQAESHPPVEAVIPASNRADSNDDTDKFSFKPSETVSGIQEHSQRLYGFGTSRLTRAGPRA